MKKILNIIKNNIFGIVISILLGFSVETMAANISAASISYSNSKTTQTTVKGALDELIQVVGINRKVGITNISSIGDGTVTGALDTMNSTVDPYYHYGQHGNWRYRHIGNGFYHITSILPYLGQELADQYGNLYFKMLRLSFPVLPFAIDGDIYGFDVKASSPTGLLDVTLAGWTNMYMDLYISDGLSGTRDIYLNFTMIVKKA